MKNIKTFEGFVSNIKDAIKNKDAYHLFKGKSDQTFGDRSKIDAATLKELVEISEKKGLKTEKYGKSTWAWIKWNGIMMVNIFISKHLMKNILENNRSPLRTGLFVKPLFLYFL